MYILEHGDLLETLSKEEFKETFLKYKNGDRKSFEKLVLANIHLTVYLVRKYFPNAYDKEDLYSISFLSLIEALQTFDIEKNICFSSYLTVVLRYDFLYVFRKERTYKKRELSYEYLLSSDLYKHGLKLQDTLESPDADIVSNYEKKETIEEVRKLVFSLPEREKEIICLYFGFYDDNCYNQSEIAKKLNISQAHVSRILKSTLQTIKSELLYNMDSSSMEKLLKRKKK